MIDRQTDGTTVDGNPPPFTLLPFSFIRRTTAFHSQLLVVKQLTFDIEQYIAEVLRTSIDFGHRYASFTDYDAQILDVSSYSLRIISWRVNLIP